MKAPTSVALFSLISGIAAYPALKSVFVRDCQPGHLVCQGQATFGICNIDRKVAYMSVSEGTKCVCSGSDCTIVALDGSPTVQPTQGAPAPAPSTQAPAPAPTSQAPAPSTSQAAPPAPSSVQPSTVAKQPAPQATQSAASSGAPAAPSTGGIYHEVPASIPTVTLPTSSAAPSATSSASAAPSSSSGSSSGGVDVGSAKSYIKTFLGNGAASAGWPSEDQWASFSSMWDANSKGVMTESCAGFGQANNSPDEIADIKTAIENVAQSSGVDARFILAVVMQESNGCVRAPTTNYGVTNPGLMQSHDGSSSCYNVNPCPKDKIQGMIEDGVNGTPSGDGLKQLLAKAGGNDAESFYKAARMYNSGSIDPSGDLGKGIATHCYASDVANRLIGWSAGVGGCHM